MDELDEDGLDDELDEDGLDEELDEDGLDEELDEDGLDEELGLLRLTYRPSLHTSAAGNHAPEALWHADLHGAHPAFSHFHPPHLPPAQDLCSLLDRLTILPFSSSQYIDPRYLGVSMGSDENISVLYFSIPSTGLLCMDELKDEYNLPHSVKSVQGADFHSQVDALAIFTGAIRGRRRTSYRAISEAHVYLIVAWFKKFFGRPKTIFCP